jgi:hypothetical protein
MIIIVIADENINLKNKRFLHDLGILIFRFGCDKYNLVSKTSLNLIIKRRQMQKVSEVFKSNLHIK